MLIRKEKSADSEAINDVQIQAFANHPISKQTEHLIVDELRKVKALSVSLVAEDQGKVVGHIAFSPTPINGNDLGWFTLGPIGVLPERQRQGVGAKLIREGLESLRELGAKGCCLVGDPNYYRRFGFTNTPSLSIPGVPDKYFMCLSFSGQIPHGKISLHPAFFVAGRPGAGNNG